ncbi:hypothetical protein [Priestia koreensis]|uniref:hypothetical protein n=1 Tax=Priestia koreensis TaxID=284581 RepID=UPI0034590200
MLKLYFWALSILIGITIVRDFFTLHITNIHTFLVDLFQLISIVGFYGYVFKKFFGNLMFWKIFSVFYVLWYISDGIYLVSEDLEENLRSAIFAFTFGIIFNIPLLIGLIKYGFKKNE